MMDLLGSDLPVESDDGMKFAWSNGILLQVKRLILKVLIVLMCLRDVLKHALSCMLILQALKEGSWVLLDELNLAPQSVLEALS